VPSDIAACGPLAVWAVDQLAATHGVPPGQTWRPKEMERVVLALRAEATAH
jgi:hypothetical protein